MLFRKPHRNLKNLKWQFNSLYKIRSNSYRYNKSAGAWGWRLTSIFITDISIHACIHGLPKRIHSAIPKHTDPSLCACYTSFPTRSVLNPIADNVGYFVGHLHVPLPLIVSVPFNMHQSPLLKRTILRYHATSPYWPAIWLDPDQRSYSLTCILPSLPRQLC
jgi:hypothetical protein